MSAILCERRKELFVEGDRWFELKRNGRPEFWVAAKGKKFITEKYLYTFPIPKADIRLFPDLLIQNDTIYPMFHSHRFFRFLGLM